MTYSETLEEEILKKISLAEDQDSLEEIRIAELGKKGKVSLLMKDLSKLSPEDRKEQGSKLNILKKNISNAISSKKNELTNIELEKRLLEEKIDITLPVQVNQYKHGKIHPVSQVLDEISEIFGSLGYKISEGPDIETEHYNFNALNIPEYHPARQMHDTFYLNNDNAEEKHVLRTHTSPVQVRTMEKDKPPFKFISPGRTYRCDSDQTHTPMFHQIEGLVVDEETHLGHLKWTLETFFKSFFELDNIEIQLRPSYFPFTEPSAEVDIGYKIEKGKMVIGEGDKWLEILGCGMVHPNVLKNVKIDTKKYQGFAFGIGIDRLAMLKYGINDLRAFFEADYRWLSHFGFDPLDVPTNYRGLSK